MAKNLSQNIYGSIGYHTISAKAYKDEEGNIIGFEGFIVDKTDKRLAEIELLKGRKEDA